MTISATTNRVSFSGNDVTTAFAFAYPYRASTDFTVIQRVTATGVETAKALTTDYTISGVANTDTGGFDSMTLTMLVAPPTGTTLHIIRKVPPTSSYDPTAGAADTAPAREGSADRAALAIQGVKDITRRALLQPETATNLDLVLPDPTINADGYLKINAAGTAVEAVAQVDLSGTTVSAFALTVLDDADATAALATLGLTISTFIKTLLDDATAAALFTTLGFKSASATIDFASVNDNATSADTDVTVTGAAVGDIAFATASGDIMTTDGVWLMAKVVATNTVGVALHNDSSGAFNATSQTVYVFVIPKSLFGL